MEMTKGRRRDASGARWAVGLWLAVAIACGSSLGAGEVLHERWEALYLAGKKVGHGHIVHTRDGSGALAMYRTEVSQSFTVVRNGDAVNLETVSRFLEEPKTGKVMLFETEQRQGEPVMQMSGRTEGDTVRVTVNGKEISFPYPQGAVGPYTADQRIREKGFEAGTLSEVEVFNDRDPRKAAHYRNEVIRREVVEVAGKPVEAIRCDVRHSLFPDMNIVTWLDDDGHPLVVENPLGAMGTMRVVTCDKATAMKPNDPPDLFAASMIVPSRPLRQVQRLRRATFQITSQNDAPVRVYSGEGQDVHPSSTKIALVTVAVPGLIEKASQFQSIPVRDSRWEQYLRPTTYLQSDDPKVVALAGEIAGDEKNPVWIAKRLERVIFEKMRRRNLSKAFSSAAEVAKSLEGDCTEHAVLAAAVARAIGLPSRVVTGLAYLEPGRGSGLSTAADKGAFGFHMWAEVMVGPDVWWPVDAALGGFTAAHIAIQKSALDQIEPALELGSEILLMVGALHIEVVATEYL
ncbi:MAG: transglutaminase family protein [Verrucomicrobiae bacterium]|nr:transglutaminase family protein [Verrucomicrobiae bacterium]